MYERMSSYVCHHPLDSEASIEASFFFFKIADVKSQTFTVTGK